MASILSQAVGLGSKTFAHYVDLGSRWILQSFFRGLKPEGSEVVLLGSGSGHMDGSSCSILGYRETIVLSWC